MILIAALLLGGFLMYRWKKRKERQAALEAKREAERLAREEAERAEKAELARQEEAARLVAEAQAQAQAEKGGGGGQSKAVATEEEELENLTEEERQQLEQKKAILKLIDEKPAEVAWLIKMWLVEDE